MFQCYLCEKSCPLTSYFCDDCHSLKRTISLYGKEVHTVVKNVFIRTPDQQVNKISIALKKQIEDKKKDLDSIKLK